MGSRKIDKAKYGPGWGEVIIGAVLSLALGAVLAVAYLVATPVAAVKVLPNDRPVGTVYYIEGSRSANDGKQWLRKKQLFTEGSSVVLNEDELNAWITTETASPPPEKPAPGQKAAPTAPAAAGLIELGPPNFRIRDGLLQIGSKGTLNLDWFGLKRSIIVQVAGRFVKQGGVFVFAPEQFCIGSCPIHKLPGLGGFVFHRLLAKEKVPDDLADAWKKLADVSIEENTLKLTMP
jgi:hypothetical protein